MDEITKEFLVESYENLDRLDQDLVALEKDPASRETLSSIFRTIHTLKGTSGFLGFGKLEAVSHVGENLLSKLRDGVLFVSPEITSALLATVDAVRYMLGRIEATGQPGDRDFSNLIALLSRLNDGEAPAPEAPAGTAPAAAPETPVGVAPVPAVAAVAPAAPAAAAPAPAPVDATLPAPAEPTEGRQPAVSDSTIRVDVGLLDRLMTLVGELVLARNQMLQFTAQRTDSAFLATSQRLNLITTELQGSVMKTRMQPIGNVWNKLPRVVRDLATLCGKQVRIELEGQETELDKTIIEAIKDPLTHIVRNSVDHGIESPETRTARGKPAEGCLKMRAYHEGGQVNIEIIDDGGGINAERVLQKALQRGLITGEQAARMSEHEITQLIFLPGFSTAEKVTNVSGRGVGMDVVKTNIEKIGGTVDLQSAPGAGTTLKIRIPLTLAIIPALIVTSGGDRFAIPQVSLLELVRLEGEQARREIESIHGAPVYRLRGQLLPLVYLDRELRLAPAAPLAPEAAAVNIVVLHTDGHAFGLVVDAINDTEEIVVKPLGKQLKGVTQFAGATIMGDGRVALILDVPGFAQGSGVLAETRSRALREGGGPVRKTVDSRQTLLLFEAGQGSRMAMPLALVARLEEIPRQAVEFSGVQEVVRYRGQILPLIRVAKHLPAVGETRLEGDPLQVVVYSENGRSVGLVVGRISDIVKVPITAKRHAPGNGIFGSVTIQDRVVDLLDVPSLIRAADPTFFGAATPAAA
ncbi:MAG: chemotaxis protein CheW [Opitutaceae bacterium]|nr:chemotaxis protein CheW [Opitutaceae bacterium]